MILENLQAGPRLFAVEIPPPSFDCFDCCVEDTRIETLPRRQ
jgi:hypothetical protein